MATDHEGPGPHEPAGPEGPDRPDSPVEDSPPAEDTGLHPSTGGPTGTAPRAVLRPVPEGFPTPPPRPARPNRRPALPAPEPPPAPRRSGTVIAVAVGAALVLLLGIAGAVLAMRALTGGPPGGAAPAVTSAPQAPEASTETGATEDESAVEPDQNPSGALSSGTVLGDVTVSVVSTEVGVASVGDDTAVVEPRGQFVTVVLELTNDSDQALSLGDRGQVQLQTSDGALYYPDPDASAALDAPTAPDGEVPAGGTGRVHAVFDIPADAEPQTLHIDLTEYGGAGPVPWAG